MNHLKAALLLTLLTFNLAPESPASGLTLTSDADAAATVQNIRIDTADLKFDPDLNCYGTGSVTWRAQVSGDVGGYDLFISRGTLGAQSSSIAGALKVFVVDQAGDVPFTPSAKYSAGVSLADLPETPDKIGTVRGPGTARFTISVEATCKARDGNGAVSCLFNIVGRASAGGI